MPSTLQNLLKSTIALSALALGIALFSQHGLGMRPCAYCVLQRLILLFIIVLGSLALLLTRRHTGRGGLIMSALTAAASLSGIAAAWYQSSVAANLFSCSLTLADRIMTSTGLESTLPWLFGIYASCMDARVNLLGIEYAHWALALFVVLSVLGIAAVVTALRSETRSS